MTGGTRGIGRGISEVLASSNEYDGLLLTYNTNKEAAETYRQSLLANRDSSDKTLKVEIVGGDLTTIEARNNIFNCVNDQFSEYELATVVHNAGQYIGLTADNASGLSSPPAVVKFGDGSMLKEDKSTSTTTHTKSVDLSMIEYYQKLYGTAFIDICERSIEHMKKAYEDAKVSGRKYRGSIVGISSPGCNSSFKVSPGYDLPGSGKCVMEYSIRLYALELGKYGINCNVIIPGFTRSDAWDKVAEFRGSTGDVFLSMIAKKVPMQEVIEATDIGDTVKFLAGSGGGRFITGISLRVDAGTHLGLLT